MPHLVHHQIAAFEGEPIQDAAQRLEVSVRDTVLLLLGLEAEWHGVPDLQVVDDGRGAELVVVPHGIPQVVALALGVLDKVVNIPLLLIAELLVVGGFDLATLEFFYLRLTGSVPPSKSIVVTL
jgi:hypothetical protein